MQAVDVGYKDGWGKQKEQEVACEEIGTPERQLDDFDDELASRLRHGVVAESSSVPLSCPPCPVGLVVLELAGEEDRDEDLVYCPLDEDGTDKTEHCMRDVPQFQEPLYSQNKSVYCPHTRSK